MTRRVLVLNGPNLSRLGSREPSVYGSADYPALERECVAEGDRLGLSVEVRQSDRLDDLLDWLAEAQREHAAVVINPAAFTHYSVELGQACAQLSVPLVEVHLSNPHAREPFRARSVVSRSAWGVIAGFGFDSYRLALRAISEVAQ